MAQDKPAGTLSRQRLYQINHVAQGLCMLCSEPLWTKIHCEAHARKWREYIRTRRQYKAWTPGGPGKPPKERENT